MATHGCNCCLGRDSSAGASLAKHHCDGLAIEGILQTSWGGAGLDGSFVGGGIENEGGEFGGSEVCDAEEMARFGCGS